MEKIILYYKFAPLADPEAVRLWQKTLAEKNGLRGRIIISKHGINGTLGGDIEGVKAYVKETKAYLPFKGTEFKWADGGADNFPKLSVKVRDELVTFGAVDELQVDENGVVGGGKHLKPEQVHELVDKYGDDVVFFDGRSTYEAAVGKFKNSVVPNVRTAKDFIAEIEKPEYEKLKDKPVVTYCTGGIRCEVLSALMKNRGFKDVYQMDGGIVKYGEKYGDEGLWEGSLYVFDGRTSTKFTDKAKDIGDCVHCGSKTSTYKNCANKICNELILVCDGCSQQTACSDACMQLATETQAV
ncbi:MAG TPA: rhodanese-related sulfurtransferase [Patescibacteria group bacterium]|nr:rhodanese-related sulfurtransferase [Patescibacteria group bacterium]